MPPLRVGIATEGPASADVLKAICDRRRVLCRASPSQGKDKLFADFHKMLKLLRDGPFRADTFLVVPDLHPRVDCIAEAQKWKVAIQERFPEARLCLAIWQTESWLIADSDSLRDHFGLDIDESQPDRVGEPSPLQRLEIAFRKKRGYGQRSAFDKKADGVEIASRMNVAAAARSPSLSRFLGFLRG